MAEDTIHKRLERSGGIAKPKWHNLVLELPLSSVEGSLLSILRGYQHLVVTLRKIELGQYLCLTYKVKTFLNSRKGVAVLFRNGI